MSIGSFTHSQSSSPGCAGGGPSAAGSPSSGTAGGAAVTSAGLGLLLLPFLPPLPEADLLVSEPINKLYFYYHEFTTDG